MKKLLTVKAATGLILFFFCLSCSYYKADKLNPPDGFECDTTNVTFNGTIINILGNNCLKCHSAMAYDDGAGIYLDSYEGVKSRIKLITGAINHTGVYLPMPKNKPMLDPCLLLQFEIWIRNGMPEN